MRDNTSAEFLHNPPATLVKPKIEGWEVAHNADTGKPYSRGAVRPVTANRVSIALSIRPTTAAGHRHGQRRVNTNPTGTSTTSWNSAGIQHLRPVSAMERSHAADAGARPLSAQAGPASTRLKPRMQHHAKGTTPLDKAIKGLFDRNQSIPGVDAISARAMVHSGLVRPLSAQSTVGASGKLNRLLSSNAPRAKTLQPKGQTNVESLTAGQDWVRPRPTHSGVGQPRIHSWGKTQMGQAPAQYSWQTGFLTQGRPFRYFGHSQAHVVYV